jgi:light-regulated signal transduction histidine kinase (bacteriophytochrome)
MGQLIDDLLAFCRIGRSELHATRVNSDKMVRSAILLQETQGRSIAWNLAPLPEVQADPALLHLVWANLLSNAVKYTRHREQARIEIGTLPKDSDHIFFVRDNGAGFDMQYAHKLFGVFQRLHGTEEFEGTGIGLANVRRIIGRHEGRTWAEGQVDAGATFYFTLPKVATVGAFV